MEDKATQVEVLDRARDEWRRFFGRAKVQAYVRPRYSGGSPAMVDDRIAYQVARDEKEGYARAMEGVYGEEQKARAELLGLRGTAYFMAPKSGGKNFRWLIYDLVTGEYFHRLHDLEIEKLGFKPFEHLSKERQQILVRTGRRSDYDRTFWKMGKLGVNMDEWVRYEPELIKLEDL